MADEIDPNAIPFVPPADVSLIDTQTGKPKTSFHDWMQSLWDWMKRSVVDLTTKVTTLTASIGDLEASIEEEATIRETEDGILAASITTVEAKANNATASGQVYLAAKAGPSGTAASYGWYLTAGSAFAGMEAMALSAGGSAIGFAANQFRFVDSGTALPVFTYSGSKFQFTGDVAINGNLMISGSVLTDGAAANAFTQVAVSTGAGDTTSVTLTTRASASGVVIMGSYNGGETLPSSTNGTLVLKRDGTTIYTTVISVVLLTPADDVSSAVYKTVQTSALYGDFPSAGSHTYSVEISGISGNGVSISVLEAAR